MITTITHTVFLAPLVLYAALTGFELLGKQDMLIQYMAEKQSHNTHDYQDTLHTHRKYLKKAIRVYNITFKRRFI